MEDEVEVAVDLELFCQLRDLKWVWRLVSDVAGQLLSYITNI